METQISPDFDNFYGAQLWLTGVETSRWYRPVATTLRFGIGFSTRNGPRDEIIVFKIRVRDRFVILTVDQIRIFLSSLLTP